jgi:hypothetical protein
MRRFLKNISEKKIKKRGKISQEQEGMVTKTEYFTALLYKNIFLNKKIGVNSRMIGKNYVIIKDNFTMTKKTSSFLMRFFKLILALPTFPGRYQPSILSAVDFTAVFGMGTGVSPQLYTPEIFHNLYVIFKIYVLMNAE